ncbi:MAG: FKBP-type peptidyl-prolyl cis-trans isomerase, partial [Lachnospiraceae bacterium]|nr:FKBP-type peptidyl-prolyl cis-trans isomerase [Lachnospiraceae bacterium]
TVKKNSIVNVDYEGKKDGVAFSGGTAQDVTIDVKNNMDAVNGTPYIDGFTDGLVGAKVGDSVDCPVTFPENYGSADLAGADVVFTFKINYIAKDSGIDASTLTDEYVKENFGVDTVKEFRDSKREELESQVKSKKNQEIRTKVIDTVVKNSSVKSMPEGMLEKRLEDYKAQFESMYVQEGTLEDYLKDTYGVTMKQFEKESKATLTETIERELIFLAIADKEKIEFDNEGFETYVTNLVTSGGLSSKDDLYMAYGTTKEAGKKYIQQVYMCNKAVNVCVDSAKTE